MMEEDDFDCYDDVQNEMPIYSNRDSTIFQELIRSGKVLTEICSDYDNGDETDDFSSDEEEEEENQQPEWQPAQEENVQDWHPPVRPPFPIPRNHEIQDEACEEDPYLTPLEPTTKPGPISIPGRKPPGFQKPSSQLPSSKNVPWKSSPGPKPSERGPAPLPHQLTSQGKMPPDTTAPSLPPPLKPRVMNRVPFQGSNNSQTIASENGRVGGSFLHRTPQEGRPSTLPKIPRKKESPWVSSHAQEKNDHVYETVDNPVASHEASDTLPSGVPDWKPPGRPPVPPFRNQNQDVDDQGLSSRLGAATLSHKTQSISRKQTDPSLVQSPSSLPRKQIINRPPKAIPPSHRRASPEECQPPQESAPLVPSFNQPYVKLDDEQSILLTPLYQKIMELPYFHMISRSKAKTFMMNGENGTFLIRPSTRTGNPLTLTLKQDNRPYNINIRQRPDSLFALGDEKPQEQTFSSIAEIVSTYKREPIKLKNGQSAILKHTPPKQGGLYVKHYPAGRGKKY